MQTNGSCSCFHKKKMETFSAIHSTFIYHQTKKSNYAICVKMYTKDPSMDKTNHVDLVREKVFATKLGIWREYPHPVMLYTYILREVCFKLAFGLLQAKP